MSAIISRYARAFADVVQEKDLDREGTEQALTLIAELLASSVDLRIIWQNPSVPGSQKRKVLDWIVGRAGASQMVRNFIAVLIDHHRISALAGIMRQLEIELNQRMGFTEAEVATAHALNDSEKRTLVARLEKLTGRRILARYETDASLLGGAVVKAGSTVYDGSLRRQLRKLREQLSNP